MEREEQKLLCKKHNLEIGGVCSNINCLDYSLLCIMCATDTNSCIRQNNHELITIEEFLDKFAKNLKAKNNFKNISDLELIKIINDLKIEKIESNYIKTFQEQNINKNKLLIDLKTELQKIGVNQVRDTKEIELYKALSDIDKIERIITDLESKYGFAIFNDNNSNLDLKNIFNFDRIEENNYFYILNLAKVIKYLKNQDLVTDQTNFIIKFEESIKNNYKNSILKNNYTDFDNFLASLDYIIPKFFQEIETLFNDQLNSTDKETENPEILTAFCNKKAFISDIFSYQNHDLYNTTNKQKYLKLKPDLITFKNNLTGKAQTTVGFSDIFCIFETKINKILSTILAFPDNNLNIDLYDITSGIKNWKSIQTIKLNQELIKIEHYNSNNQDILITLEKNNIFRVFNKTASTYTENTKLSFKSQNVVQAFEIIELNLHNKHDIYICYVPMDEALTLLSLNNAKKHKLNLIVNNKYCFCIKAFYNKLIDKKLIVVCYLSGIYVFDPINNIIYAKFETVNNLDWVYNICIIFKENLQDYYILSSNSKVFRIFSSQSNILINELESKQDNSIFKAVELLNPEYCTLGLSNGDIQIININTMKSFNLDKLMNSPVIAIKRYIDIEIGDCLITYDQAGNISIYGF